MEKIFLAGFNVYSPETKPAIMEYQILCTKYGCKALFPTTIEEVRAANRKPFDTPLSESQAVFRSNLKRIDSADVIIANLDYYSSYYSTSDTIFEIGYAYAKNKRIIGYVDHEYQTGYYTMRGCVMDQVGQPSNLMVACATMIIIQGSFDSCLEYVLDIKEDDECKIYTPIHRSM